jgi:hypothetical protein
VRKYLVYFVLPLFLFAGCDTYQRMIDNHRWSIGIYEGSSPFDLKPMNAVFNPVLTAYDVTDIDAAFVADPFIVFRNGTYYMFFEVQNRKNDQGDIAYAESADGKKWHYKKVIIDEKFHLSYPYVFEWNNDYYLIPESHRDHSIRLYKATGFPDKWEYTGNILSGDEWTDPSIFRYKDKWWMLTSTIKHDALNVYFSDDLTKGWRPHPQNPVIASNRHIARSGGRVIIYNGKPLRFAQDDDPDYGIQVFAFEITGLSDTLYIDKLVSAKPVITKTGRGWNEAGMHHIDLHHTGNKWIAVVDGRVR